MTLALREAIYTRWENTGLTSSVAPLYAGERDAAPEQTPLPRAQYNLSVDTQRTRSRGAQELLQNVRFLIWGSDDATVQQHLDRVEAAFVDAELADENPFSLPPDDGRILSVDYVSQAIVQENRALFQGVLDLQIQWCRTFSTI